MHFATVHNITLALYWARDGREHQTLNAAPVRCMRGRQLIGPVTEQSKRSMYGFTVLVPFQSPAQSRSSIGLSSHVHVQGVGKSSTW